jgi:hypothetical protein
MIGDDAPLVDYLLAGSNVTVIRRSHVIVAGSGADGRPASG